MSRLVFLIGSPRSGTTLLGEQILMKHPGVKYIGEINHIWKYSNVYRRDEVLGTEQLNRFNRKKIRAYFDRLLQENPGKIIVEKTPTNCLRIPFINELFPDARYVFIYRNGYDTVMSLYREWSNTGKEAIDSAELRKSSLAKKLSVTIKRQLSLNKRSYDFIDLYESPYYFYRMFLFLLRNVFPSKTPIWGPRTPGLSKIARTHELTDTCAIQWQYCMEKVLADTALIPEGNKILVRYENIIKDMETEVGKIMAFLGEEKTADLKEMTASIVDRGPSKPLRGKFSISTRQLIDQTNAKIGYSDQ